MVKRSENFENGCIDVIDKLACYFDELKSRLNITQRTHNLQRTHDNKVNIRLDEFDWCLFFRIKFLPSLPNPGLYYACNIFPLKIAFNTLRLVQFMKKMCSLLHMAVNAQSLI